MSICLYCSEEAKSKEHPLPAAFGEFESAPLLYDRICRSCNTRLGLLDEQFTRSGPEAFFRKFYGIKGRQDHDKINPFYRGSAGGRRLKMRAHDESLGIELELEYNNGQVRQLRQLVFVETSGKMHSLPIPDNLRDPAVLRAEYFKLGVNEKELAETRIFFDPEDQVWLEPLLTAAWPSVTFPAETTLAAKSYQGADIHVELTDRYFRALAKIAFHYFLTQCPSFNGSEPCFSEIRRFLTEEGSSVMRANEFIGQRKNPLLGEMIAGARPDGWIGHVLTAEITPEVCLAHVQLFVSQDYSSPAYTVQLATNSNNTAPYVSGHAYIYFPEGPKGKFSGAAYDLTPGRIIAPPAALKQVVQESR